MTPPERVADGITGRRLAADGLSDARELAQEAPGWLRQGDTIVTMHEKSFLAPDISCGHCVATIRRELGDLDGVVSVEADAKTKRVRVRFGEATDWAEIAELLSEIGFPPREL